MRYTKSADRINVRGAVRLAFAFSVMHLLSGCLPGLNTDDAVTSASFADASASEAPAVNRSYKTSFLALQAPSASGSVRQTDQGAASSLISASLGSIDAKRSVESVSSPISDSLPVPEPIIAPPALSLNKFYNALMALSTGKRTEPITILHFGDGQTADDRFTSELREHFQSRFGNAGRGLMMPGFIQSRGMKIDRSGAWMLSSSAEHPNGLYGIAGVRVSANTPDAWIRLTSTQGAFDWSELTFATAPQQGTAIVSIDGDPSFVPTGSSAPNETSFLISRKAREILIRPKGDGDISLMAISTGIQAPGIRYINLGLPNATAETPGRWDGAIVEKEITKLKPDLIILGYGMTEGFQDDLDIKKYERHYQALTQQFKQVAPQASIMMLAPSDAARLPDYSSSSGGQVCRALNAQEIAIYSRLIGRKDQRLARWHAPPKLEAVRAVMRRSASSAGAFYWDWAKFMGGACSVHAWAWAKPSLAAQDHVTITNAGMEKSGRGLFTELMTGYETYQRELQAKAKAQNQVVAMTTTVEPTKPTAKKKAAKKREVAIAQ